MVLMEKQMKEVFGYKFLHLPAAPNAHQLRSTSAARGSDLKPTKLFLAG